MHFSVLGSPVFPLRLTVTVMQTVSPASASTRNSGDAWMPPSPSRIWTW